MVILATFQPSIFSFFQIEPVGDKRLKWTPEEPIECPTEVCFKIKQIMQTDVYYLLKIS